MAKGNQVELYHHTKDFVQQWIAALKDSVILVDLKEDYLINQMIGKGNFAKVHLCKRKSDNGVFALKSVEKTLIRKSKRNSVRLSFGVRWRVELDTVRDRHPQDDQSREHHQNVRGL